MALPDDRVPTLVQYCQRVAAVHVDSISSLGDDLRYDLVKPILERCTVDQLSRLEQASPYLQKETPEIWKVLCFRTYPSAAERYRRGEIAEPDSWKDEYFVLVQEEARRFEEVGSKIRRQRLEAEERKKESEIKITTQQPMGKRRWGNAAQPKSLFQKTKSEVSRLQKNMYSRPMLPPMSNNGKNYRVLPAANSALLPTATSNSRVTVNTVVHRVSFPGSSPTSLFSSSAKAPVTPSSHDLACSVPPPSQTSPSGFSISLSSRNTSASSITSSSKTSSSYTVPSSTSMSSLQNTAESPRKKQRLTDLPPAQPDSRQPKSMAVKRDPMASLFLPKHRAYSQRIK